MEIKKQKINKIKIKNSFIDLNIIFKFDFWYIHKINEEQIEKINRFVRFYNKSLCQKEEILLNDYLKNELRKIVALKKERLKIDVDLMDEYQLKYDEKENTLEKILLGCGFSASLKRLPKKNCETNENKFSIKILKTKFGYIKIGLTTLNVNHIFGNSLCWDNGLCFDCNDGMYMHKNKWMQFIWFNAKDGDVIGIKYNSKEGEIELFINNKSKGILCKDLNVNEDYRFAVKLIDVCDKIQIIE